MNRDQIEGKVEEVKGDIKKRIGGASEDPGKQAEGWAQEKKGQVQKKIGDLEEESARREDSDAHKGRTS
ncbi:MAG TPA: CsbD family protein [Anaeromyxobacter sp.]|nr:CsbD family protein [Anaeromyxobacter sp.]